jgi:WhiB family redox-sensing transcriptional regulator
VIRHVTPLKWQDDALCAEVGTEMFFPEKGSSTTEALKICAACPVKKLCRDYAMSMTENPPGVWGGTTFMERRKARERPTSGIDRSLQVIELFRRGWTDDAIGESLGISGRQVGRIRRKNDLTSVRAADRREWSDADDAVIREMVASPNTHIADRLGRNVSSVRARRKALGLSPSVDKGGRPVYAA